MSAEKRQRLLTMHSTACMPIASQVHNTLSAWDIGDLRDLLT